MRARADALATKVEKANNDLLAAVEASTPEQWKSACAEGDWTQGFAAYHASASVGNIAEMVKSMAQGEQREPITFAQIDEMNAEFHQAHAGCTKDEALEMLRVNAPAAAAMARGLKDAELDRKLTLAQGMPEMSVEQVAEMLMVGHPTGHLKAITDAR